MIDVSGLRETIEQPLNRIMGKDPFEILPFFLADPEKTGPNGGADVPDLPRHWR